MIERITTLVIWSILFTSTISSQVTSNKYEIEVEKGLAKENPQYYNGLKIILQEFQEQLFSKGIIEQNISESYIGILEQIVADSEKEFEITYNLNDSLKVLNKTLNKDEISVESSVTTMKYFNINNSKIFLLNQKISEIINNDKDINRSTYARLIMEVFDEKDFELPLIKLKLFRLIDPNSDSVFYVYVGRPNPE